MIATSTRFVLQSKVGLYRHLQQHSRVCVALVARPASRTTRFAHYPIQRQRGITTDPKLSAIFQGAGMGKVAISSSAYVQVNRQFACIKALPAHNTDLEPCAGSGAWFGCRGFHSFCPAILRSPQVSVSNICTFATTATISSTFALNINKDRTPDPGTCSTLEKVFRGFVFSTK